MNYSTIAGIVGSSPIQNIGQVDSSPRHQPGTVLAAVDAYWGAGEFMYARAGGTISIFAACVLTPVYDSTLGSWRFDATEVPNTANLGRPLAVAMSEMASGEYGWFCLSGIVPIDSGASVAADTTFGITAAGKVGANSAGKQVLNARIVAPATTTVAKANCVADNASKLLRVTNSEGWFRGLVLSGTGIATGTTITKISPDGREVTLSLDTTARVSGTVTGTYNDASAVYYNVAHINRPFAQGAIS